VAFVINNRRPLSRYRPPPHRSLRPLPPRWADPEEAMARSPLAQFIVLSMLLHAMAIMLFGAPSGGSPEGRAMWGALDVVIRGPLREERIEAAAPPAPTKPATQPGASAIPERKSIPEEKPVIPDASKEATVGHPISPPVPPLLTVTPEAAPPAFEVPPPTASQPAPAPEVPAAPVAAPVPEPAPIREIPAVPLPPLPRLERVEPMPVEAAPAPTPAPAPEKEIAPIELEALPRMEARPPPIPAPPVEALPSIERVEAPPKPAPVAEPPPVEPPRIEPRRVDPPRVDSPRVEPRIEAPAVQPSPFRAPSPSAGPRKDVPSTDYDPTAAAPSLDAEALRKRAAELARQGTGQRAALPFPMPPIPARKSKMEEAIENARKPDCRTAYQSLGLAAVVPLIANQFGEGNCRW
jgi:hypothetical protein